MNENNNRRSELSIKSSSRSLGVSSENGSDAEINMLQENYHPHSNASLRTCFSSSTRWFQLIMFIAFVFALIMTLYNIDNYRNISSGLIWGACLSLFSVIFVIFSYASVPSYRQHPNPLMFWRTIADACFVMQLLAQQFVRCLFFSCHSICNSSSTQCGCETDSAAGPTCEVFAGLFEFSLIAAEAWYFCMTLNLLVTLTNPFTDFKRNTRYFHLFCWGTGLIMGVILMNASDWAGFSDLGVCWTNALKNLSPPTTTRQCDSNFQVIENFQSDYKAVNANIISWFFFYVWMALIIIFGIAVWIWAWKRLSEGMPETYAVRVQSIQRARFNVLAVTFYWLIVAAIYIIYLSRTDRSKKDARSELLNFVIAGKGYVDLVIWFALNDFRFSPFTRCWYHHGEDVDVDLNPQVNAALRREVLFYTTSGIIQAVQAAERLPASQRIQHLALLPQSKNPTTRLSGHNQLQEQVISAHQSYPTSQETRAAFNENLRVTKNAQRTKTFHDYEPHAFKKIRQRFGVNNEDYLQSLSATAKERLSEGASGAFMFFSADGALIVKSTSKEECSFLRSIAQQYADYLCANPKSLMTRFYGCHCLELYGKQFSFIVMANLFDTDQVIHCRYDIKGSWVNRHGDLPKRGKKVTCRHCNRKYMYQNAQPENANCPLRLGGHEPNVVLKDSDLTQKLKLDRDVALDLYKQLCADSDLLCSFGIMDYSLLMGINEVEYVVDESSSGDELPSSPTSNVIEPESESKAYNKIPMNEKNSTMEPSQSGNLSVLTQPPPSTTAPVPQPTSTLPSSRSHPGRLRHHVSVSSNLNSTFVDSGNGQQPRKPSRQRDTRTGSTASISSSGRRLPRSGMRLANTVVGPSYYHLGIIDILQTWTFQKRLERYFKIVFKGVDGDGLSAIEPKLYRARFQLKMADILGVDDLVNTDGLDLFTQQNSHMDVDTAQDAQLNVQLSARSLSAADQHYLSARDGHYGDRSGSSTLRQRTLDHPAQSVGQDTEEYSGIDYHL